MGSRGNKKIVLWPMLNAHYVAQWMLNQSSYKVFTQLNICRMLAKELDALLGL